MNNSKDIQRALFVHYNSKQFPYMGTNTQALYHEADFLAIARSGYMTECEIKISRSDFKKDFIKTDKHTRLCQGNVACANYFYFACPADLIHPSEIPAYAGLLWIDRRGGVHVIKSAPVIHKNKPDKDLIIKILRSVMYKYFNRPRLDKV
jgi:hypothetical protein